MTEPAGPRTTAAQPSPEWPESTEAGMTDPLVVQALAGLHRLPDVPVSGHEAAYNALHDALLAALDTDPAGAPRPGQPPTDGGA